MSEIPLHDVRDLSALVGHAIDQREPVWLIADGSRVAAVVDAATLHRLLRALSRTDAQAGQPFGDSDKADLGL